MTVLGGLLWILSVPALLLAGWLWAEGGMLAARILLLLTIVLWNLGYILDVVDGSVARLSDTQSSSGAFLDFSFHLIFHPMFLCSIGTFLFLVADSLPYLVLAILATFTGWGVSFSAKEHVLCEHIARGQADPSALSPEDRYRIYIDSIKTKQPVSRKAGRRLLLALASEIFCFPGQYTLVSLVVIADLMLAASCGIDFPFLRIAFVTLTVVPMIRVPFRLRREFRTLELYDHVRR